MKTYMFMQSCEYKSVKTTKLLCQLYYPIIKEANHLSEGRQLLFYVTIIVYSCGRKNRCL